MEIKLAKIDDQAKLKHVKNEHDTLAESFDHMRCEIIEPHKVKKLDEYTIEIKKANEKVWDVLQRQRELERAGEFGHEFVKVSLEVYHVNDERAEAKRKINELFGTDIAEVKFYPNDKNDQNDQNNQNDQNK